MSSSSSTDPYVGTFKPPVGESGDMGRDLLELMTAELKRRLREGAASMSASELELIRKLLSDNAVTLASIRRGDFGTVAQQVAEEFPFPEEGTVQ